MVSRRVAVLIDGDNVSAKHSGPVLTEAKKLGRVDIARIYAAANCNSDWLDLPEFRFIHAGKGKNAADLLLCIDAMEFAITGGVDTFAIASSDGDFTHLAQRLREKGLHVLGMGEAKAPDGFRLACTEFRQLDSKPKRGQAAPTAHGCRDFDFRIRDMIRQHSTNGRGMRIADLAPKMHAAQHPDQHLPRAKLARLPVRKANSLPTRPQGPRGDGSVPPRRIRGELGATRGPGDRPDKRIGAASAPRAPC